MNHKRGRPKNCRAGCLLCKPHKMNHAPLADRSRHSDYVRELVAKDEMEGAWEEIPRY